MRLPLRCVFKVDMHYKDIFSFNHLLNSYNRARRDNREKHSVCRFDFFLENNLLKLKYELQFNSYYPFPYTCFIVTDPKKRNIAAPHFRDRVVQHALVSAIEPLFDKSFIKDAYACRSKKGTHYGARRMKKFLTSARCIYGKNTPLYILQCDIKKFFPFVSWDILLTLIKKKIICKKTLSLIETILTKHRVANKTGSINSFPPEIVSTTERKGLPIGNLTSQLFANVYLNPLDHFVKEKNPDGGSWKKSERAKKQGGYTLRDHNFLFRSLQASNTKDEAKVTAGNAKVNYAGYHQYGKGDMKRKFMWISKGIRENITKILGKFFIGN